MTARGDAFVDHAHRLGATVAGATDTQGEAPKFWVVEDEEGRWHPDSGLLGSQVLTDCGVDRLVIDRRMDVIARLRNELRAVRVPT